MSHPFTSRIEVFLATTLLVSLCAAGTAVASWGVASHAPLSFALSFVGAGAMLAGAAGSLVFSSALWDRLSPQGGKKLLEEIRELAREEGIAVPDEDPDLERSTQALVSAFKVHLESAQARVHQNQRLATVGEFAGALGCELRSPLLRITQQVEDLAVNEDPERAGQIAWQLQGEVDQMCRLVSDIVAFSRVSTPQREAVDLCALAREIAFELPAVEEVKVVIDQSPDAPRAWADNRQVRTALYNIMKNGIEAMPEGGILNIRIDTGREDRVMIEVRDRGPGISPEDRQRIFEPLFTTKPGNTGLGMGIARNLIENNGGRLNLYSTPGQGTSVRMEIPGTREHPEALRLLH